MVIFKYIILIILLIIILVLTNRVLYRNVRWYTFLVEMIKMPYYMVFLLPRLRTIEQVDNALRYLRSSIHCSTIEFKIVRKKILKKKKKLLYNQK